MTTVGHILLGSCLAAPFAAALLTGLCGERRILRDIINLAAPFVSLVTGAVALMHAPPGQGPVIEVAASVGAVVIGFSLEPLGAVFAGLVCILWPLAALYTISYLFQNRSGGVGRFLVYYNLAIGSALGIAFSSNLLTLFIFYEILTLCTYPLVTHGKTDEAKAAGRLYLATLLGASTLFLLAALIWVWYLAGTLDFTAGGILKGLVDPAAAGWLLLLFVAGTAKAAIMPFHAWLPRAMVAPVPVSALLHAVAVVKAGVFTIVKIIVYVFGTELLAAGGTQWLVYVAGFTIIAASLIALRQTSLKKLLAYSTVSQLSYIVLGAALLKPVAIIGAALHILAHGFGKIALFFAAGAIQTAGGRTRVDEVSGLGRAMPWTMGAFALAALSIIGLPPLAGFTSKWFILSGASFVQQYFVAAVIVISTVLNMLYFVPILHRAFFSDEAVDGVREAPAAMLIATVLPALMGAVLFFNSDKIVGLFAGGL